MKPKGAHYVEQCLLIGFVGIILSDRLGARTRSIMDRAAKARETVRAVRVAHRDRVALAHRIALDDPAYRSASGQEQYNALLDAFGVYFSRATFYRIRADKEKAG